MAEPKKKSSLLVTLLKVMVLGVLLLVAGVLAVTFFALDGRYEVSRSITVKADKDDIHELCAELKNWPKWQPWTKDDPSIKTTIEKDTGVGARQHWTGKDGTGDITFTACDEDKGVEYDMVFDSRYKSRGSIRYEDAGKGEVKVTWAMNGQNDDFVGKWFAAMMPTMVGPMFEDGLKELKSKAEAK